MILLREWLSEGDHPAHIPPTLCWSGTSRLWSMWIDMDECAAGRRYVEREGVMALSSVAQCVCGRMSCFSAWCITLTKYILNLQMTLSWSLVSFLTVCLFVSHFRSLVCLCGNRAVVPAEFAMANSRSWGGKMVISLFFSKSAFCAEYYWIRNV